MMQPGCVGGRCSVRTFPLPHSAQRVSKLDSTIFFVKQHGQCFSPPFLRLDRSPIPRPSVLPFFRSPSLPLFFPHVRFPKINSGRRITSSNNISIETRSSRRRPALSRSCHSIYSMSCPLCVPQRCPCVQDTL